MLCCQILTSFGVWHWEVGSWLQELSMTFLLFLSFTTNMRLDSGSCHPQKFSDDRCIVGHIYDEEEEYKGLIESFTKWYNSNHLKLNISKTKELVVDHRRTRSISAPITFRGRLGSCGNAVHPLHDELWQMDSSSSQHIIAPRCKTERFRGASVPAAIRLFNTSGSLFRLKTPPAIWTPHCTFTRSMPLINNCFFCLSTYTQIHI